MKLVYIAGPFTAKTSWEVELNVRAAEMVGLAVAKCGAMPIIPHTNTRFFHDLLTPAFWYEGTLELLNRCDGIVLTENWKYSIGAYKEREAALGRPIPMPVWEYERLAMGSTPDLDAFLAWCKEP